MVFDKCAYVYIHIYMGTRMGDGGIIFGTDTSEFLVEC